VNAEGVPDRLGRPGRETRREGGKRARLGEGGQKGNKGRRLETELADKREGHERGEGGEKSVE